MIYTSYFANLRKIDRQKYLTISVAKYNPKGLEVDYHFASIAPLESTLRAIKNDEITWEQYIGKYRLQMSDFDFKDFIEVCKELEEETKKDIILLCYEKPPEHCHRHLFAMMVKWSTGYIINELEF